MTQTRSRKEQNYESNENKYLQQTKLLINNQLHLDEWLRNLELFIARAESVVTQERKKLKRKQKKMVN